MKSRLVLGTSLLLSTLLLCAQEGASRPQSCATVHGRYAIYADGDRLWVTGSKHFLDVGSDELDKQLRKRGWEKTVAYGDFTICADSRKKPEELTIRDKVSLKEYRHIRFADR